MTIQELIKQWPITRILWLALGLGVLIPSIIDQDIVGITMGLFLTIVMGIMKKGCRSSSDSCDDGTGGCKCG